MIKISKRATLILNYIPIAAMSSALVTPALPEIKEYYKLTLGQLEWVVSIFLIGYMFGQLIYGPWANIAGRVKAMKIGLIIGLVGIIACYLGYYFVSFPLLLVGRFVNAIGSSSGLVCAIIIINEELKEEDARAAFAFSPMAFSFGVTFAIFLGGIISHFLGWQYTFLLMFLHSLVMIILTIYLPQNFDYNTHLKSLKANQQIKLESKNVIKLIFMSFIVGSSTCLTYLYTTSAPLISKYNFSFNASEYGLWNLINLLGVAIGSTTLFKALEKLGGKKTILTSLIILCLSVLSFTAMFLFKSDAYIWYFLTSCLMYFGSSWGYSSASYYASNAIANKALGTSILSFLNITCAVIGVIILGYLTFQELLDFVIVGASFLFCAFLCYAWISKNNAFTIIRHDEQKK